MFIIAIRIICASIGIYTATRICVYKVRDVRQMTILMDYILIGVLAVSDQSYVESGPSGGEVHMGGIYRSSFFYRLIIP